jgi:hypothetical protein
VRTGSRQILLAGAISSASIAAACPDIPLIRYEADPAALHAQECDLNGLSYIALGNADGRYLSLGGEIRQRYEYTHNPGFGADPQDPHGVWLQRFAFHSDLQWSDHVRVFAELHSVLENGRAAGPSPVDEDELEFQNAFLEGRFGLASGSDIRVRVGRQELQLGSARLISVRDGPNVRRTFDGVRVMAQAERWTIDAIAVRPRKNESGIFDDSTDDTQALWGLYLTRSPREGRALGLDAYYLVREQDDALYDQGSAAETRRTLGLRFFGSSGGWTWNVEPMVQFGEFGTGQIRAWTIGTETGYTWSDRNWQPSLKVSANIGSGDRDRLAPDLQTFSPLYPRGNYFSEDSILGPQNFYNLHPFLTLRPSSIWALTADYNVFWRMSVGDGVYGPNGSLVRSGEGSRERLVATALSITSEWTIGRQLTFTAIYTHFSPREFLEQTGPSEAVDFLELTGRFRF